MGLGEGREFGARFLLAFGTSRNNKDGGGCSGYSGGNRSSSWWSLNADCTSEMLFIYRDFLIFTRPSDVVSAFIFPINRGGV